MNGLANGYVSRVASRMVLCRWICDSLCCFCVLLKYAVRVTTDAQEVFNYTGRAVPKFKITSGCVSVFKRKFRLSGLDSLSVSRVRTQLYETRTFS